MDDLAPRIISALLLMPVGIGAAVFGGPWLAGATGAALVIMSYEWARMSEPNALWPAFWCCVIGGLGAVMAQSWGLSLAAFAWLAGVALLAAFGRASWAGRVERAGGVLYIGAPCVAFVALRAIEPQGLQIILALFVIIWSADIAAYFCGRFLKGPKLMPQLSPAKTWTGLIGGTIAGALAGWSCAGFFSDFVGPRVPWMGLGAALAFIGLCGDLFESALKRRFGVKDASGFIPGHGGFLDRLDGLMAATLFTALLIAIFPQGLDFFLRPTQ
jgi:phosphatidate cytidylyltransferase